MKSVVIIAALVLSLRETKGHKCSSLKDVNVKVVLKDHSESTKIVSGCIEPSVFNRSQVIELYVWNNKISNIYPDTIRNMARLASATFYNCQTRAISSGAFRNVPRLTHMSIERNNVGKISVDVFNNLPALKWLYLDNDGISEIEEGAFANGALESISLSNNQISEFNKNWFSISEGIRSITIDFNEIQTLRSLAFEGLPGLRVIQMNNNKISSMEPGAFQGLRNLHTLGLQGNRLSRIDRRSFPNKMKFQYLFLNSNKINYLPSELLQRTRVKFLTADGNPWKCPCWEEIRMWLNRNNATLLAPRACRVYNVPSCVFPEVPSTKCEESVDDKVTQTFLKSLVDREGATRDELSKCVCFE